MKATALKNVAHAQRSDPTITALVRCVDVVNGDPFTLVDGETNVPKGVVVQSTTPTCFSGTTATGGGWAIHPDDAKVRLLSSRPIANHWIVEATR